MKQDAVINQLANITGKSRKEVIEALRRLNAMPEVQKFLAEQRHD